MEKSMLLDELFALRKADKAEREQLLAKLDRMTDQLLALNENSQAQTKMIDEFKRMLTDRDALIEKLQKNSSFEEVTENFLIGYFPLINHLLLIINHYFALFLENFQREAS